MRPQPWILAVLVIVLLGLIGWLRLRFTQRDQAIQIQQLNDQLRAQEYKRSFLRNTRDHWGHPCHQAGCSCGARLKVVQ